MKTNWYLTALCWLSAVAIIVGVIMVVNGQPSDDLFGRPTADLGLIWSGSGLIGFGALCLVAALVTAAIGHELRWCTSLLTMPAKQPQRPEPQSRPQPRASGRQGQPLTWTNDS